LVSDESGIGGNGSARPLAEEGKPEKASTLLYMHTRSVQVLSAGIADILPQQAKTGLPPHQAKTAPGEDPGLAGGPRHRAESPESETKTFNHRGHEGTQRRSGQEIAKSPESPELKI
jgi:hypothetical protein